MSTVDGRGKLASQPFSYQVTRDKLLISWQGRVVKTLAGEAAARLRDELAALADDDVEGAQLLLARATGNFKRGNEKGR